MPRVPADRPRGSRAVLLILALLLLPACGADKKGAPTDGGATADATGAVSETPATPPAHLAQALAVVVRPSSIDPRWSAGSTWRTSFRKVAWKASTT